MKKKIIAIFEDNQINRFIYKQVFNDKEEVEVHIFDSPGSGIAKAKEMHFDVVFIEIHFWSNFGGIDILKRVKQASASSPTFIAMTSFLQEGDLEQIMHAGFSLCMEKPVVFSELKLSKIK